MTNSFKEAAIEILKKAEKPLHYKEITELALSRRLLESDGKTPWATMMARLSTDIKENGEKSLFFRTEPGHFSIRKHVSVKAKTQKLKVKNLKANAFAIKGIINKTLSTKQKGDLSEARVAELITLYGNEGLSCYKPISDDEGIDIIVKRRGKLEVVYVQVKSTYGYRNGRGFVSVVKERILADKMRNILVFVYFDLTEGDLYEHVFCIPVPEFLKLTENDKKKTAERVFTMGLVHPENSKFAKYMIEKRELANKIVEIMDKL